MGEVYRAWDERLERWVAIKQIFTRDGEDLKARERLRREARTVASLNHPAIVNIHDILESEPGDWIVMELVEGQTLHAMLLEGPLQISQALYLAVEVVDGLAEAHAKGVVHRDLKTENVMVTPSGHAKILDFGLAKRLWPDNQEASLSVQGTILGTGRAMSPEQVLGEAVDHRSDLFSFGTLLFEMTTGDRPFVGTSLVLTLAQVCSEDHPSALEINPDMPEELSSLIDRLLEKEPGRRPQSAREVAALLSSIAGIPLPDRGSSAEARRYAGEPTPTQIALTPSPRPASRSPSRSPTLSSATHESTSGIFIKTLVRTELVGLEGVRDELGESAAFDLFSRHDRMIRDLLGPFDALEVERTVGGFLLLFERPLDGVHFGILYHDQLAILAEVSEVELEGRVAIHLGEVILRENTEADVIRGAKPIDVEGPTRTTTDHLASLGRPGQTLVSQEAAHLAQRGVEGPSEVVHGAEITEWVDHGLYAFGDGEETFEVFEVVGKDHLPHAAPDNRAVAHRLTEAGGRRLMGAGPLLALATLILVVALGLGGWWSKSRSLQDTQSSGRPTVAVLGFQNLGQPEDAWMTTSLADLINNHLQAGGALRLIARESVARAQMELGLAAAETLAADTLTSIRRNLGNDYLVLGSLVVVPQGEDRQLSLQLYLQDTRRLETVASWSFEGRSSDLLDLGMEAGQKLREHLGVGAEPPPSAGIIGRAQPRAVAAADYYEGLEALRRFDASTARVALLRSIEADPGFPLAHAALAQTWRYLGFDTRAQESATRAYELSADLPRTEALWIAGQYHEARGDWASAVESFQGLRSFFPDDLEYGLLLADAQIGDGQVQEALETLAEVRSLGEPASTDPRLDLTEAEAALALGDEEGALEAARKAVAEAEDRETWLLLAEARRLEGLALFGLERFDEAREAYADAERWFSDTEDVGKAAQVQTDIANLLVNEGRLEEAEELYLRAMNRHREIGSRKWLADVQNGLAYVMQARGELERATELLTETLRLVREAGDSQRETIYLDTLTWVLLQQGRWGDARARAIENLDLSEKIGARERAAWAYYYLGRVAFSEGELTTAQSHYGHSLAVAEAIDNPGLAGYALRGQAEILIYRGMLTDAETLLLDARLGGDVFGENIEALNQQSRARLDIERGRVKEAVELSERAYRELFEADRKDEAASAGALVARAFLAGGRAADARHVLGEIAPWVEQSLNPWVRLEYRLVSAQLAITEGRTTEGFEEARRLIDEAEKLEIIPLAFEARLMVATLLLERDPEQGLRSLEVLVADAHEKGFGLIRDRASQRLRSATVDGR